MTSYNHAESYNGSDITIDVYLNTGLTMVDDGRGNQLPERTHSIYAAIDGEMTVLAGITKAAIAQTLTDTLSNMKALVDNVDDPSLIALLSGLGYSPITALDAPANLTAGVTLPAQVDISFDAVTGADHYLIQRSELGDFSDAVDASYGTYASTISLTTDIVSGTAYSFRVFAIEEGVRTSPASYVDAVAT